MDLNQNDYYPFGMLMPGRKFDNGIAYRYGFNGKENDNEVKGEGNQQDYGMRIYDPRLGRFLSVDPLTTEYPWNSPYSYAEGDPINYIDIDGAETGSTTAQATLRVTMPTLSNLTFDRNGNLVNQTQLFTNLATNSGVYAPQSKYLAPAEIQSLIPLTATGIAINPDGQSIRISDRNGHSWNVSIMKPPKPNMPSWFDRVAYRAYLISVSAFNYNKWNTSILAYEIITTDPATLDAKYLSSVNRRLLNGTATAQDKLYANEVTLRKTEKTIKDPKTVTFIKKLSNQSAIKVTTDLPEGYTETSLTSQGQKVYTNGKTWISPDITSHVGGVWKMFDNEKNVGSTSKDKRVGTYDANLNRIDD